MKESQQHTDTPRFRHQIVLSDPVHYESVKKEPEFELKFRPHRIPNFLQDAMRVTQPIRIDQVYVIIPLTTKKGKEKLVEGRIRQVRNTHSGVVESFSVEKKKKRKGVGVNGEARLMLSPREERTLQSEFQELIASPTVPKVQKMRYEIPTTIQGVDGTVLYHVDVFEGELHGFVLIEVELESEHAEEQFRKHLPLQLKGSEVTDIHAFRNAHLAFSGAPRGTVEELRAAQQSAQNEMAHKS